MKRIIKRGTGELKMTIGEVMEREGFGDPRRLFDNAFERAIKKFGHSNIKIWHIQNEVEELMNEWLFNNAEDFGFIFTMG